MPNDKLPAYRRDGFWIARGLFPKTDIQAIHDEAKSVFATQLRRLGLLSGPVSDDVFEMKMRELFQKDRAAFVGAGKQCQHLITMHRLSLRDEIVAAIREFGVSHPVISTRPVLYFNSRHLSADEGYYKSPTHQDWRSMQGSLDSMVVWLPLVAMSEEIGALQIIPGSHRRGLLSTTEDPNVTGILRLTDSFADADFQSVGVEAGDAIFFSSFLVHRSGDNVTDRVRWSMHFRYNNLDEPEFIARRYPHPYIYKPDLKFITPGFPTVEDVRKRFDR